MAATIEDLIPHIYHEKQQEGSMLCAQHALNSLLRTCSILLPPCLPLLIFCNAVEGQYVS